MRSNSESGIRRGMTLIELLVVITIMLILTAVAIPIVAPNVEGRRLREAARSVSTFISSARNRAIDLGRPVGVKLERLTSNPHACMVLSLVEVPPPYSGDLTNSVCAVYYDSGILKVNMDPASSGGFNSTLVRVGDRLKINYQGFTYSISTSNPTVSASDPTIASGTTILILDPPVLVTPPWTASSSNGTDKPRFPYQIIRQPVKSTGTSLQLPEGTAIDLAISGTSGSREFVNDSSSSPAGQATPNPPILLFSPNGSLTRLYDGTYNVANAPAGPLHLLVGRVEGVANNAAEIDGAFTAPDISNLRDLKNIWVSIGPQTGLVSSAENGRVTAAPSTITTIDATYAGAISDARAIARSFQSMGGS